MIWRPDTCNCQMEFDGPNDPEHFTQIVKKCIEHTGVPDKDIVATVFAENQTKNRAMAHLLADPRFGEDKVEDNGDQVRVFRKGMEPSFAFDQDRKVVIKLPQSQKGQKASIGAEIAAKMANDEVLGGRAKPFRIE